MEHGERIPAAEAVELFEDFAACTIIEELIATIRSAGGFAGGPSSNEPPIRLAWGERDRTLPFARYGRPFAELVQGAEIAMLRGVGHVPMYDDPALVADTIIEVTSAVDAAYDTAAATLEPEGGTTT
jgi:pimeloyl-ACP methyl ester carboxylesterase